MMEKTEAKMWEKSISYNKTFGPSDSDRHTRCHLVIQVWAIDSVHVLLS